MKEKENASRRHRQALRDIMQSIAKKQSDNLNQYSRQVNYDDLFDKVGEISLGGAALLAPPYAPGRMYELYEESSVLNACVNAYVDNIDGYGYDIVSMIAEDDTTQSEENPEVIKLKEFFDNPNDAESFTRIREKLRRDLEITGNAYLEIVRGRDGEPVMAFWADSKRVRISVTRAPVTKPVTVRRGGKDITINVEKRYRSYAMLSSDISSSKGSRIRYFKEYGDPRIMDATTGEFEGENQHKAIEIEATELIHFKVGNGTYGIPRWIGSLLSVMGVWKANSINYDLFDNQGIPPMIISIAGGQLTEDSFQDLVELLRKAKGSANFNKILVLEAEGTSGSLEGGDNVPRLDIKSLAEYRKEDAMFLDYMKQCNTDIQKNGFRLPGLFLGISDDANYATAQINRQTAEEQIFLPERNRFDEIINKTIVADFHVHDLEFKSNAPVLHSTDNIGGILTLLVNSGVFTVNGLISFVNSQFGTDIALYDGEWANEPINQPNSVQTEPYSGANSEILNEAREDTENQDGSAENKQNAEEDAEVKKMQRELAKNKLVYEAIKEVSGAIERHHSNCGCDGHEHRV